MIYQRNRSTGRVTPLITAVVVLPTIRVRRGGCPYAPMTHKVSAALSRMGDQHLVRDGDHDFNALPTLPQDFARPAQRILVPVRFAAGDHQMQVHIFKQGRSGGQAHRLSGAGAVVQRDQSARDLAERPRRDEHRLHALADDPLHLAAEMALGEIGRRASFADHDQFRIRLTLDNCFE